MSKKTQAYTPAMSDAAVKARTGKTWAGWFSLLDKAGAKKLEHKAIAKGLSANQELPGWWCQMVTVEYERSRGLRARHETKDGFTVAATRTMKTSVPALYAATADLAERRKWFPKGVFETSSQTMNRYFRGSWKDGRRLEVGFYPKGEGKAQIALQVRKLATKADVEPERARWKAALTKLQLMLEQ